jgi:hypothetical protein
MLLGPEIERFLWKRKQRLEKFSETNLEPLIFLTGKSALPAGYFSSAASRRAGCESVRGNPLLSSHFSPRLAPQVGQRTSNIPSLSAFMTA